MACAAALMLAAQALAFSSSGQRQEQPLGLHKKSLSIDNGKISATINGNALAEEIFLSDTTLQESSPSSIGKEPFPFALLRIIDHNTLPTRHYRHTLSSGNGMVNETYQKGEAKYHREYFLSRPDHLLAIRLWTDKAQAISVSLSLSAFEPHKAKARGQQITMTGHLTDKKDSILHFCSILKANTSDGKVFASDSTLTIDGATEVVLYYVNETSLNNQSPYIENAADDAWHTVNYTYEQFRERHLAYFRRNLIKSSNKKRRPYQDNSHND